MDLDRFSVATFNLYNLQLPDRAMNPGQRRWTEEEFARKAEWTAGQLARLDADIVGLQELWNREAMERMAAVDRNVLRSAVAEFLGYPETPKAIVINEALEIARKYSSPESVTFINGVLDSIGKDLEVQAS